MVAWIRENKPAKLEGLWKSVLPEGSTAPPAEYAADLFWLLHQGHILLFTDDTLVVQEAREATAVEPGTEPKKAKKKKKKSKKPKPEGEVAEGGVTTSESPAAEATSSEPASAESPDSEASAADVAVEPAESPVVVVAEAAAPEIVEESAAPEESPAPTQETSEPSTAESDAGEKLPAED